MVFHELTGKVQEQYVRRDRTVAAVLGSISVPQREFLVQFFLVGIIAALLYVDEQQWLLAVALLPILTLLGVAVYNTRSLSRVTPGAEESEEGEKDLSGVETEPFDRDRPFLVTPPNKPTVRVTEDAS